MSTKKQDFIRHEMLASEVNSHIQHVKEEIRASFAAHMNTLASREQWLLDQVDSIKEGMLAMVTKNQISAAKAEAKLEECMEFMRFSKEKDFSEGVGYASAVIRHLQSNLREKILSHDHHLPKIRFAHDRALLQNAIVSYGKLEPGNSDHMDAASIASERSWDLVEDKNDEVYEMENDDKELDAKRTCSPLDVKRDCCGGSGCCDQDFYEIEDIDITKFLSSSSESNAEKSKENDMLKNVCKANELCSSFSECICDVPCDYQMKKKKKQVSDDPVLELHSNLKAIYTTEPKNSSDSDWCLMSKDSLSTDPVVTAHRSLENALNAPEKIMTESSCKSDKSDLDFFTGLSCKLQDILDGTSPPTPPAPGSFHSFSLNEEVSTGRTDTVGDLHCKMQCILDGERLPDPMKSSSKGFSVMEGFQKFDGKEECFEEKIQREVSQSDKPYFDGDLSRISQRLATICQIEVEPKIPKVNPPHVDQDGQDPVRLLAAKLQHIIAC